VRRIGSRVVHNTEHMENASRSGRSIWTYAAAGAAVVAVAILAATLLVRTQLDWKDGSPAWSPDGTRIAFSSERDGNAEIYVMKADGSGVTRLTNTKADDGDPSWSPDGKRIAFVSGRNGKAEIFTMNADGSDQKTLVSMDRGDAVDPRWSPDGATIAFVHRPDGVTGSAAIICTVSADGAALRHLR
jgi:Tol biopolymer transport system component